MPKTLSKQQNLTEFMNQLQTYKTQIDADIEQFSEQLVSETHEQFGNYPTEAVKAYVSLLTRGGKRIRGALTMTAYHMLGGTDEKVALRAARIIEMLHAYILMVDDIQDRSEIRRGGPAAHILLKNYHEKAHLKSDSQHFGESIAMNGLLFGLHRALDELYDLPVEAERRLQAIHNINRHFMATVHGQSLDLFNEVIETVDQEAVDKGLRWKTAYYTFMYPLQFGAILAGASETDLKSLENYSLHAGRVFQITDDILGTFGSEEESGKSPLDDIKEGKRTILVVKALEQAPKAEFVRCQQIMQESGALDFARQTAKDSAVNAVTAINAMPNTFQARGKAFLKRLVTYLIDRKA